jgi:hypothetical protein
MALGYCNNVFCKFLHIKQGGVRNDKDHLNMDLKLYCANCGDVLTIEKFKPYNPFSLKGIKQNTFVEMPPINFEKSNMVENSIPGCGSTFMSMVGSL